MVSIKLREIATNEGGVYSNKEYKTMDIKGSRSSFYIHSIRYSYKGCLIESLIQTGENQTASIECILSPDIELIDFKIISISPFSNLFLRRSSRFKVRCDHKQFKFFLEKKALPLFESIMKTRNFDPNIFSTKSENKNKIKFEFHLAFSGWVDVFVPINSFFKLLIDELGSVTQFQIN